MRTNGEGMRAKPAPPEKTHAEEFYWIKQMHAHTRMAIALVDGNELRGTVVWYDRDCIKLTRVGYPNLLVYKQVIKYVYKDDTDIGKENGDTVYE